MISEAAERVLGGGPLGEGVDMLEVVSSDETPASLGLVAIRLFLVVLGYVTLNQQGTPA